MSKEFWSYCDGIITPYGDYILANQGHVNALIYFTGLPSEIIYDMMPIDAAPLFWLIQYTNCVVINYDFCIAGPNMNELQKEVYLLLVNNNVIRDNLSYLKEGQI